MKKILCLVLAMLMLAGALVSCNTGSDPEETTAADTTAEDITTAADTTTTTPPEDLHVPSGEPANIKVMSFNLQSSYRSESRVNNVFTLLSENPMDVYCFQECDTWMSDLGERLKADGYVLASGTKIPGNEADDAIYYNKNTLTHIKSGFFTLMKKGTKVGSSECKHTRYFTYAVFEHYETGKQFMVINTHLDNSSDEVRLEQAKTMFTIIKNGPALADYRELPMILCGDMNADYQSGEDASKPGGYYHPTESTFHYLNDGSLFKWATEFEGTEYIYENTPIFRWYPGDPYTLINNAFKTDYRNDGSAEDVAGNMDKRIIDFIFLSPNGSITPHTYEVLYRNFSTKENCWKYASDHMPLMCDMTIN